MGPNTPFVLTSREIAGAIPYGAKAPPGFTPAVSRAAVQRQHVGPPRSRLVVARFWSWLPRAHHFLANSLRLVRRFEIRPWLVNDAVHSRSTDTGQSDGGSIDFSIC